MVRGEETARIDRINRHENGSQPVTAFSIRSSPISRSTLDLFSNPITRPLFIVCGNVPACVKAFRPVFVFFLPSVSGFSFRTQPVSVKQERPALSRAVIARCYCMCHANWFRFINKICVVTLFDGRRKICPLSPVYCSILYSSMYVARIFPVATKFQSKTQVEELMLQIEM